MSLQQKPLHGLMAEFHSPDELMRATHRTYEDGYRRIDAFSPFPIDGLAEALGFRRTEVPALVLGGGIFGAVAGYALQYYCAVISYPLNVGGRPLNSWPAFIPIVFEMAVLCAAVTAVIGMLFLNGLPQPYHPAFNVPRFALASRDRFFLLIDAHDPHFEPARTTEFLSALGAHAVSEVEP